MSGRRNKDDRDLSVTAGRGFGDGYGESVTAGRGFDDGYEKPVITRIQLDDDEERYDPDDLDGYGPDRSVREGKGPDQGRRTADDRIRSRRELIRRRKNKRLRDRDAENEARPEQNPEFDTENGSFPEQDPESEDGISAETASEERERLPKKRRLTERERKVRQTIILLAIFAAACVALLLVVVIFRHVNKVEIPLTWSNAKMAYTAAGQSAMQTETAFSTDLCIGPNNVTREGLSLTGNERGALFSLDDRKVVFAKEMHEKIYPASITKLMTAILAFKSDKMDETVTIQWQDLELESGSQVVGLRIGDQVTMHDLMRGLLIHSGNDCAQAIARVVGGSQDNFVNMMNEELKAIGATESHFTNPTGLHDENHYTSVYDIYLMLHEAMKNDEFISIIQIPVYDFKYYDADGNEKHVTLDSTDRYLTGQVEPPKDVTVLGGKTGTTSAAGNCLSLISQNAYGQFFISVVTGATSKEDLYGDMNGLLSAVNM